jgi:methionine-gamma-lyase
MSRSKKVRPATLAIHSGLEHPPEYGAVSVPIYQSSTFSFDSAEQGAARFSGEDPGYKYTRLGNPTVRSLARIRPETQILFIESPANPTIKLTDIAACAELARECSALLVVDNTFSSPLLQQPFKFGADVVIHSLTKYLNGHSDVVGGVIVCGAEPQHQRLAALLPQLGGTMDPHQAWLVLRGVRTLEMRVEKAQNNARHLAGWLESHPDVAWVSYPGLESHPQHKLMLRQMNGPGSMISFGVRGGLDAARRMINAVRLAVRAVSLGGVETLIEHPASMTHAGMPQIERLEAGIRDDLVRLAVGCEAWEDLQDDLEQALQVAHRAKSTKETTAS